MIVNGYNITIVRRDKKAIDCINAMISLMKDREEGEAGGNGEEEVKSCNLCEKE